MNTGFLDVFHDADDDSGAVAGGAVVRDAIDVAFDGVVEELINQVVSGALD